MARSRTQQPEDRRKPSGSRKTAALDTSSLRESDEPKPSVMLTLHDEASMHTLQRTVGNRAVVDMIQRQGESGGSAGGGKRLYVGNLSFSTTQETVRAAFTAVGEVREVSMPTDRETGQPRGFAFVTMGSGQDAYSAIERLNGSMMDGRPLRVNEAQERESRGGSFGGGGGRGGGGGGRGGGGGGRSGGGGRGGRDRY